jgi:universal stress protein A
MFFFKKILCPTDFSDASRQALANTGELAAHFEAEVWLVHVLPASPRDVAPDIDERDLQAAVEREMRKLAESLSAKHLQVHVLVGIGDAADEIVRIAQEENADLIVIATQGTTGWRHFAFGSVTEKVVRLAKCPVLTIRAEADQAVAFQGA